jgi:hypothetical protein
VSIHAAGAAVPWHALLLVYGAGIAAQSLNITPGGLGVTEGTLGLALVATGLHANQALAAVLLYRLASFWLMALAGWLVLLWLKSSKAYSDAREKVSIVQHHKGARRGAGTVGSHAIVHATAPGPGQRDGG